MTFIKGINVSSKQTMGLYKLNDKEQERFNGNYALFQSLLSDYALKNIPHVELLENQSPHYGERVFYTQTESEYFAKIIELTTELRKVRCAIESYESRNIVFDI